MDLAVAAAAIRANLLQAAAEREARTAVEITGIAGKTAVITGSSKGIGRAAALTLAEAGANVVINHRDSAAEASEVKARIEKMGRRALVVQADAGVPDEMEALFDKAIATFGGVDIAVHNALFTKREFALDLEFEDWQRAFAVCVDGGLILGRRTAQDLIRRGVPGSITYISSVMAIRCPPRSIAYNAAKNAVRGLAYSLAAELMEHQIRVNVIQPGWINTPGERRFMTEEQISDGAKNMPFGRLGRPEEIASVILFLASDLASFVNGVTIRVDSGSSLGRNPAPRERY